jgi:hypothetical protein
MFTLPGLFIFSCSFVHFGFTVLVFKTYHKCLMLYFCLPNFNRKALKLLGFSLNVGQAVDVSHCRVVSSVTVPTAVDSEFLSMPLSLEKVHLLMVFWREF